MKPGLVSRCSITYLQVQLYVFYLICSTLCKYLTRVTIETIALIECLTAILEPLTSPAHFHFHFVDRKGLGKDSVDKRKSANKEVDYRVDMSDFRQRKKDKLSSNNLEGY